MQNALDIMQSKGMNLSASHWTAEEFAKAGLPLVVSCKVCYQTLAFPSATVADEHKAEYEEI